MGITQTGLALLLIAFIYLLTLARATLPSKSVATDRTTCGTLMLKTIAERRPKVSR